MKYQLIYALAIIAIMSSCFQPRDVEAQKALTAYTQFVDSIAKVNETWKLYPDTHLVEVPVDVNDPSITLIDTMITTPDKKAKSIVLSDFFGNIISKQYETLHANTISNLPKMDEEMKKQYELAKAKYDGLQ